MLFIFLATVRVFMKMKFCSEVFQSEAFVSQLVGMKGVFRIWLAQNYNVK